MRHKLSKDGVSLTLIDESYNANPASMRAALQMLATAEPAGRGRRVAVLGDMLELGVHSRGLHAGLAEPVVQAGVDKVFACGPEMTWLWKELPGDMHGACTATSQELIEPLLGSIQSGDVIMVKGSLGSKMGPGGQGHHRQVWGQHGRLTIAQPHPVPAGAADFSLANFGTNMFYHLFLELADQSFRAERVPLHHVQDRGRADDGAVAVVPVRAEADLADAG